jgi:hypothetical protein
MQPQEHCACAHQMGARVVLLGGPGLCCAVLCCSAVGSVGGCLCCVVLVPVLRCAVLGLACAAVGLGGPGLCWAVLCCAVLCSCLWPRLHAGCTPAQLNLAFFAWCRPRGANVEERRRSGTSWRRTGRARAQSPATSADVHSMQSTEMQQQRRGTGGARASARVIGTTSTMAPGWGGPPADAEVGGSQVAWRWL